MEFVEKMVFPHVPWGPGRPFRSVSKLCPRGAFLAGLTVLEISNLQTPGTAWGLKSHKLFPPVFCVELNRERALHKRMYGPVPGVGPPCGLGVVRR